MDWRRLVINVKLQCNALSGPFLEKIAKAIKWKTIFGCVARLVGHHDSQMSARLPFQFFQHCDRLAPFAYQFPIDENLRLSTVRIKKPVIPTDSVNASRR